MHPTAGLCKLHVAADDALSDLVVFMGLADNRIDACHCQYVQAATMQAADDPLSGLVALLTAAQMLGNASLSTAPQAAAGQYQKRVVFAALAGEPWGLQGTRRLLLDMGQGSNGTHGLLLELVQQVDIVSLHVLKVLFPPDNCAVITACGACCWTWARALMAPRGCWSWCRRSGIGVSQPQAAGPSHALHNGTHWSLRPGSGGSLLLDMVQGYSGLQGRLSGACPAAGAWWSWC